ncbi:transposase [Piscirickettsia salmonis]|uniref:IS701 family transposase n=1 Tax=Piscirickettsia salmonis TaxID=1238 RepID=UPI00094A24EC|nr:transposase [Piscirickettsia salmonis]WGZ71925.1 transposase [Piscirickettsia salmonis EM-90]APS57108.1 hypothetical protein AVI52_07530 [Piscirickettsia salmonis]QGN78502.1 Transposase [Piscirickettsia salmonis]QGN82085.1 Transposase [Piscirickettsia salmonis]QGN83644.1 Transposase [Piscirickettsia salmonis]
MNKELLDIYSDYLISQNHYATATGLSDLLEGSISHDKVTRFLNKNHFGSKELWSYVKKHVRQYEEEVGGVLSLDDTVEEKPYTDENDVVCWHYSHSKSAHVKGINILTSMVTYKKTSVPIGYETVLKDIKFTDLKDRKEKRKSNISKNEYFRNLINRAINNQVKFDYTVADNWFSSKENMNYIHAKLNKLFILGIKSNRTVACSLDDKINRNYQPVKSLDLKDSEAIDVYLQGINFPVRLMKKIFTNEDGSTGHLYLITNDLETDGDGLYKIYQKRWKIEEYHKSIKQNASLAKSPTKTVRSQCNHIFASIVAFCKLETLSVKAQLNHFALKYKLLVRSNQIAFEELRRLKCL